MCCLTITKNLAYKIEKSKLKWIFCKYCQIRHDIVHNIYNNSFLQICEKKSDRKVGGIAERVASLSMSRKIRDVNLGADECFIRALRFWLPRQRFKGRLQFHGTTNKVNLKTWSCWMACKVLWRHPLSEYHIFCTCTRQLISQNL